MVNPYWVQVLGTESAWPDLFIRSPAALLTRSLMYVEKNIIRKLEIFRNGLPSETSGQYPYVELHDVEYECSREKNEW